MLELDRVPDWKASLVAKQLEQKGYSILSTTVDAEGPARYATQIRAEPKITGFPVAPIPEDID